MPGPRLRKLYENAGETIEDDDVGEMEGKLPFWLNGTYLKTGPGKYHFENFSMKHNFDGYANVSRFHITTNNEGVSKVHFRKKYLDTDVLKRANAVQKPLVCEFGTGAFPDPNKGFLARCIPTLTPEMSDNHNMALFWVGTNVCATGESCFFRDLNPATLELGDKHDTNKCYGLNFTSPHPLVDEETGDAYTVGSSFITGLKYNFVKIPAQSGKPSSKQLLKKSKVLATISAQCTSMISMHHSFGLTKNYIVFIEQPYVLNVAKILGAVLNKGQCFLDWLEWRPELKNKFYLINKETGKVSKTEIISATPFMFLHIINCYEDDNNQIVVDLVTFENGDFMEAQYLSKILSTDPVSQTEYGNASRFVFPIVTSIFTIPDGVELLKWSSPGKSLPSAIRRGNQIILKEQVWTERGMELPTINRKFTGQKYNFFFGTGNTSEGYFENSLCKFDIEQEKLNLWRDNHHLYPGEPIFIPVPNANEESEDDGVIISAVIDARDEGTDFLLFLDAKTFTELGRANFKQKIPFLIHGLYVPSSS